MADGRPTPRLVHPLKLRRHADGGRGRHGRQETEMKGSMGDGKQQTLKAGQKADGRHEDSGQWAVGEMEAGSGQKAEMKSREYSYKSPRFQ